MPWHRGGPFAIVRRPIHGMLANGDTVCGLSEETRRQESTRVEVVTCKKCLVQIAKVFR